MEKLENLYLEIHYGTSLSALSVETRNACSNALISLINEISETLYGNSKNFEMLYMPAQEGSYKDIIKIEFVKKFLSSINTTANLLILCLGIPKAYEEISYIHNENVKKQFEISTQNTDKCLEWLEKIRALNEKGVNVELSENELNRVCSNLKINRHVSRLYNNLEKDHDISTQEFILKDETGYSINSAEVFRKDFKKFVKNDDEIYDGSFESVHFEIIAPIVKTVKGAKSWMGEFKGRPLSADGISLIETDEIVKFYMADTDFKKDINKQEVSFKQGDIIVGNIRVTGRIREDLTLSNRKIWIENVEKYNDIQRENFSKKNAYDTLEDMPLFKGKIKK